MSAALVLLLTPQWRATAPAAQPPPAPGMVMSNSANGSVTYTRPNATWSSLIRLMGPGENASQPRAVGQASAVFLLNEYVSGNTLELWEVRDSDLAESPHVFYTLP